MSRRVVFIIALMALAVLGAAAAPWTLTGGGLPTAVAEHLKSRYGLDFNVTGRSTFALLPLPRVKFEDVTVSFPEGALQADGGILRGELRLMPLLFGQIELSEITLSETRITGSRRALQAYDWAALFQNRSDPVSARRLIVGATSVRWTDTPGADLDQASLVVSWAGPGDPLYAVGSALWRDEVVALESASIHPDLLASDRISPVTVALSFPAARLSMTGEAQLAGDPRVTGIGSIEATSVRDFGRWSGLELPFGPLLQSLSVKGEFSLNRRRLSWPSVAVTLGSDKLDGTLAVRFEGERPLITGTLAADSLNLSDLFLPLAQARTSTGAWSDEAIDLAHTTSSDLDLRLSASFAQMGRLHLNDVAASVLVRPGRIEASVSRADFHDGILKGRLTLAALNGVVEFKSQGTFSAVDIGTFLQAVGEPRWITGTAQGQFQIEGSGQTAAGIVRQAQGRSSITVKDGELVGVALGEALRRVEKRPLLASMNWKGGRTPFDQAQAQIVIKDGIGEIAESRLSAPSLNTGLHGEVSLVDRTLRLKADVSPVSTVPQPAPVMVFDVSGGWDSVTVAPDVRSLIERSGAAKPLLNPPRLPAGEQRPLATAQ